MKSEASKKLEDYARGLPDSYEDFVAFIGRGPQRHGVDEKLLEYIESHPGCGHDDIFEEYFTLTLLDK